MLRRRKWKGLMAVALAAAFTLQPISAYAASRSADVIVGTEKPWLFYKAKDGQPLETYQRTNLFTESELAAIAEKMEAIRKDCAEQGTQFVLFIAPDKETIYGERYMPEGYPRQPGQSRTDQLVAYLKTAAPELSVIFPRNAIMAAEGTIPGVGSFYYENDTHWNQAGGWIGSNELLKEISRLKGVSYQAKQPGFSAPSMRKGDLQLFAGLGEDYLGHDYAPELGARGEVTEQIGVGADTCAWLTNTNPNAQLPLSVYIAGDSMRGGMEPYLRANVKDLVVHSRYYFDPEILALKKPDIFVYEIVERYLHELTILPGFHTMPLQMELPKNLAEMSHLKDAANVKGGGPGVQ